jgi:hypothetical protein
MSCRHVGSAPEAIATPEQLQHFLNSLNERQQSPGTASSAAMDPWQLPGYASPGGTFSFSVLGSSEENHGK